MAKLTNSPVETSVLEVEARKSFAFTVAVAAPNGAPADLTGAAVRFVVGLPEGPPLEVPAVIDLPLGGTAVVPVQADDLALAAGAYPFVVVLVSGGYSLVLVKGELKVRDNPERASAGQEYGGAAPATGLSVVLAGLQVIRVTLWGGVPAGVGGGLDATGVTAGYVPTAQGGGSWSWQAVTVDWSRVTGAEAVVMQSELDLALTAYAPLAGATFTGPVHIPALTAPELVADDAEVELELRVGPADSRLSLAYGTVSATEDGTPVPVYMPTGVAGLPAPTAVDHAATKAYADAGDVKVTELGAGVDLDTITTTGRYWQSLNAQATVALHYPTNRAGLLEAFSNNSGSQLIQRYTTYDTNIGSPSGAFVRHRYNGTWGEWVLEVYDTGWKPVTITGSWTNEATDPVRLRRRGNTIAGRGRMTAQFNPNQTYTFATVGGEFCPPSGTNGFGVVFTTGAFVGWANINSSGQFSIHFKSPWALASGTIDFSAFSFTV